MVYDRNFALLADGLSPSGVWGWNGVCEEAYDVPVYNDLHVLW